MEIKDLSRDEQLACATVLRLLVFADRKCADGEAEVAAKLGEMLGPDLFRELLDESESRFKYEAETKAFLSKVTDPETRRLIYDLAWECAAADGIEFTEHELLDWLKEQWEIQDA